MKYIGFAVGLNQAQVKYLKRAFNLKTDADVRTFIENRVRTAIDRARNRA